MPGPDQSPSAYIYWTSLIPKKVILDRRLHEYLHILFLNLCISLQDYFPMVMSEENGLCTQEE